MRISVIVPALQEETTIASALASCGPYAHEVIVVDGGSRDQTVARASVLASTILSSRPGRGFQQHTGARHATGDVLLFLHADTRLPSDYPAMVQRVLQNPRVIFGAFALGVDRPGPSMRAICFGANLRTCLLRAPYGDQALFMRTADYWKIGGFQDLPIMEDVDLVKRLLQRGEFRMAPGRVRSSARRWKKDGLLRRTLGNYWLILRYMAGVSPDKLAKKYREVR